MTTAQPLARSGPFALAAAPATLAALGLIAAVCLVYGLRFNVPPVVSLQMIADPLTPIDDIEARHLANSPLWLWLAHGLGVRGFATWALVSSAITGAALLALVAHVLATFKTDRDRALGLVLLAATPTVFHLLGWSAKGDPLLILAMLGAIWAPHAALAGLCAAAMVLSLPVEGLAVTFMLLLIYRPAPMRAVALALGAMLGVCAHSAYLVALGDLENFSFHAKGFLTPDDQRSAVWTLSSLWLEYGWFWIIAGMAAASGLLRRWEIGVLILGALICLTSTVPERPAALVTLPFMLVLIERIVTQGPKLSRLHVGLFAACAFLQAEAAWVDGKTILHSLHWPGTIAQLAEWAR
ncbi:MAG: hypothetical protein KJS97_05260 [Alphaproteobacteria bacterium]|nr:hypothetical protein [Alphaproteobacteria bacterium]